MEQSRRDFINDTYQRIGIQNETPMERIKRLENEKCFRNIFYDVEEFLSNKEFDNAISLIKTIDNDDYAAYNTTPLEEFIKYNVPLKYLHQLNLDYIDSTGEHFMFYIIKNKLLALESLYYFLNKLDYSNIISSKGYTLLDMEIMSYARHDVVEYLIKKELNIKHISIGTNILSKLILNIQHGRLNVDAEDTLKVFKLLLENFNSIDIFVDDDKKEPLALIEYIVLLGDDYIEYIKLLVEHGCSYKYMPTTGHDLITIAIEAQYNIIGEDLCSKSSEEFNTFYNTTLKSTLNVDSSIRDILDLSTLAKYINDIYNNAVRDRIDTQTSIDIKYIAEADSLLNDKVLTDYTIAKAFYESVSLYSEQIYYTVNDNFDKDREEMYIQEIIHLLVSISFGNNDTVYLNDLLTLIKSHYMKSSKNSIIILLSELIELLLKNNIRVMDFVVATFHSYDKSSNYYELNHSAFTSSYVFLITGLYINYKYETNSIQEKIIDYFNDLNINTRTNRILLYNVNEVYDNYCEDYKDISFKDKLKIQTLVSSIANKDKNLWQNIQKKIYNIFDYLNCDKTIDISNRRYIFKNSILNPNVTIYRSNLLSLLL